MCPPLTYSYQVGEAERLGYDFYNRHVVEVAQGLLGKRIVWGDFEGIITETEAYRGMDDAASHAARGMTPRSSIMFGPPGHVYVYLIYGMYHCLNIVTEEPGHPSAVLIRGIQSMNMHLNGPGKICRHLGIDRSYNYLNLTIHPSCYLTHGITARSYEVTSRIGVKQAADKLWRFKER
jgi:DNA-3-methyladenine glycosylase